MPTGDAFPQPATVESATVGSVYQFVLALPRDQRVNALPAGGEIIFQVVDGEAVQISRFQATFCGCACFDPSEVNALLEERKFLSQRLVSNGSKESEHYLLFQ